MVIWVFLIEHSWVWKVVTRLVSLRFIISFLQLLLHLTLLRLTPCSLLFLNHADHDHDHHRNHNKRNYNSYRNLPSIVFFIRVVIWGRRRHIGGGIAPSWISERLVQTLRTRLQCKASSWCLIRHTFIKRGATFISDGNTWSQITGSRSDTNNRKRRVIRIAICV